VDINVLITRPNTIFWNRGKSKPKPKLIQLGFFPSKRVWFRRVPASMNFIAMSSWHLSSKYNEFIKQKNILAELWNRQKQWRMILLYDWIMASLITPFFSSSFNINKLFSYRSNFLFCIFSWFHRLSVVLC
jgi:hypothetical protein